MTSLKIVLIFAVILASLAHAQISLNNYNDKYHLKSGLKAKTAGDQLVINLPARQALLKANDTSELYVTSTPMTGQKSLPFEMAPTVVSTTFICSSITFNVSSDLNYVRSFSVPPSASGACSVSASAPFYATSSVTQVSIQVPMYYEGADETVFHSGQTISILVRPSNNAKFSIIFRIQCGSVFKNIPITTTISSPYNLPSDLTGEICTFMTPNPPSPYLAIEPVEVEINPDIYFAFPTQNYVFSSNSDITAKLVTTDGRNPSVTVILTCDGTQAATLTGLAKTVFSFPSNNPLIYGSCVFSLLDVDNYYTESTVDISILPVLTIAPHSSIAYGQAVTLLVTTNGQSSVQYTVSFSCSTGSYQVTGLTTGVTYKLVPAGIYGNTVITVTAANTMPGTLSININKYATNSPPAFSPGRLANYPSVYVNLKDVKDIKIVRPFKNKNLKLKSKTKHKR